jgi:CDP-glycerol glycerophosphotransferase
MNQDLLQKIKRVKLMDIIHIFFYLAALPISFFYKKRHKHLWLFCDLPEEAQDNGYWLFLYVRKNQPEQEAVFAINKSSPDYAKVAQCGRTVAFGSYKHWLLYLSARNVISSQKASGPNACICYILERYRIYRGNKVFLQHGIIKDDISFLYYRFTHIRLFTCSTQQELEFVRQKFGYPYNYVQLLGLCRFDALLEPEKVQKTIVIMPTWRKWLSHPTKGHSSRQLEAEFISSEYYQKWNHLINHPFFEWLSRQYHWEIVFYLHRESQKFAKFFKSQTEGVKIGCFPEYKVPVLLKQSAVMITDYSSVAMDFALLNKPLFYYQFDYAKFREKHLRKGYFDYHRDGFGPVYDEESDLIAGIYNFFHCGLREDTTYSKRRYGFFTLRDQNNCARTYRAIKQL